MFRGPRNDGGGKETERLVIMRLLGQGSKYRGQNVDWSTLGFRVRGKGL